MQDVTVIYWIFLKCCCHGTSHTLLCTMLILILFHRSSDPIISQELRLLGRAGSSLFSVLMLYWWNELLLNVWIAESLALGLFPLQFFFSFRFSLFTRIWKSEEMFTPLFTYTSFMDLSELLCWWRYHLNSSQLRGLVTYVVFYTQFYCIQLFN